MGDDYVATIRRGGTIAYRDNNGDLVILRLYGPGSMELNLQPDGEARQLRLIGTNARRSGLTGVVTRRPNSGDGVTTRPVIVGAAAGMPVALPNPPFVPGSAIAAVVDSLLASDELANIAGPDTSSLLA